MKTDVSLAKILDCCYVISGILKSRIGARQAWNLTQCIGSDRNHPQEKEMQQDEMAEEALQTAEQRREVKDKGGRKKYTHLNAEHWE